MEPGDDDLPASRRPVPFQLGYHGPNRRSMEDMTGAETLVVLAIAVLLWMVGAGTVGWLVSGADASDAFAFGILAVPLASAPAAWWVPRHPPWVGPAVLRRRKAGRGPGRISRRLDRLGEWWSRPGRPALAIALLAAGLAVSSFLNAHDDRTLVHDLSTRGKSAQATVSDIDFAPRAGRTNVTVRFATPDGPRTEDLALLDTVPSNVRKGDRITVIYDPEEPSLVLMPGQLNVGHAHLNVTMGWIFTAITTAALLWWVLNIPARRKSSRGLIVPGTPRDPH
jgi:hypothetical protein